MALDHQPNVPKSFYSPAENPLRLFLMIPATLIASMLATSPSAASQTQAATVYGITIQQGKVFFLTNGSRTATPACHTQGNRWVFSATTAEGQATLSILLTFYSSGKQVMVIGTSACGDWGDTESVELLNSPN